MNLFKILSTQHIFSKLNIHNLKLEFKIYYYNLFIKTIIIVH